MKIIYKLGNYKILQGKLQNINKIEGNVQISPS